jgi:hypothetical protein
MFRLVIDDVFDLTGNKQEPLHVRVLARATGLLFPLMVVASITKGFRPLHVLDERDGARLSR